MRILCCLSVALLCAGTARADEVLLRIDGIQNDADADAVTKALAKVESVKIAFKPTREKPESRIAFDPAKTDVGEMARSVRTAKEGTSVTLVLAYARLDGSALADEQYLPGKV